LEALNAAKKLLPCVGGETLGTEVYRIRLSGSDAGELLDAAAELRRLHAVNAELLEALKWIDRRCPKHLLDSDPHKIHREAAYDAGASARAAIDKAEEVKP
jgi:hypothetical protein